MKISANKVAVITGAASGIGEALAIALDKEGMQLVLVDVESLKSLSNRLSGNPLVFEMDVSDADAMMSLGSSVYEQHENVHLLINNAGVMGPMVPSWELQANDWDWVLNVNVKGIANGIRAFVPSMLAQEDPSHIVNTASEASFAARAFVGVYHASKHAALALTETLAQELGFIGASIRVSVLCPGAVNTAVMEAERNRPGALAGSSQSNETGERLMDVYRRSLDHGMSPGQVAAMVIEGIETDRFYLLPHPEVADLPAQRAAAVRSGTYPQFDANLARLVSKSERSG
jgi:NADP-dependent 3-hydroxy acid dehydrogenase YdfG